MRSSRPLLVGTFITAALLLAGCSTVMMQTGKLAARFLTQKTGDLSAAHTSVAYTDNAVPVAVGEAGVQAVGAKNWHEGKPTAAVMLLKRHGIGFWALDGEMTADGTPLGSFMGGTARFAFFDDRDPKTIALTSAQGQMESYALAPRPPIRITSVNGQGRDGATLDLGQPLVLELDRQDTGEATDLRIALLGTTMGLKGFWDVAVVAGQNRIELPASVYENGQGNPINTGESWLMVEEYVRPKFQDTATGGMSLVTVKSSDYVPVTVTGDVPRKLAGLIANDGLAVSGELASASGDVFSYTFTKPRAFAGPAFAPGAKLALVTFAVRATGLSQSQTHTSTSYGFETKTTTTTTRTRQFAQLPAVFYEQLAANLHSDVMGGLGQAWNVEIIPIERVLGEPRYQQFDAIADTSTTTFASASYGGLRTIIDPSPSIAEIFTDTNGPFSFARMERLMDALGVDGLVAVTVDLQMPWEEFSLTPVLNFQVIGRAADPNQWMQSYFAQGRVAGTGQEVTNEMLDDPQQLRTFLDAAINRETLARAFSEGFAALVAEERQHPIYAAMWADRSFRTAVNP